jgi:hypothetical protein
MKKPIILLTLLYIALRLPLLGLAGYILRTQGFVKENYGHNLHLERVNPAWIESLYRWDAAWYIEITEHGYRYATGTQGDSQWKGLPFSAGFFPLFPYAEKVLGFFTGSTEIAGILLGFLFGYAALAGLFYLARSVLDEGDAFRAAVLFLVFPPSLFTSLPFSEGLFIALLCFSFWALQKGFGEGLLLLPLAVMTRPQGLFLPLPLVFASKPWSLKIRTLLLWAVGLILVTLIYYQSLGSFTAFFERQSMSRGLPLGPWHSYIEFYVWKPKGWFSWKGGYIDLGLSFLALLTLWLGQRKTKLPVEWQIWGWTAVGIPLCSSLLSFQRLLLAAFPLFMYWSRWIPRRALFPVSLLLYAVQVYYLVRYATFQWIA